MNKLLDNQYRLDWITKFHALSSVEFIRIHTINADPF